MRIFSLLFKRTGYTLFAILIIFSELVMAKDTIQDDNSAIHGLWIESHKRKIAVLIEDCDQQICGQIYWLKKALTAEGLPKRDNHNPDPKLRSRFRCGLTILDHFSQVNKGDWGGGHIYNPSDGKTYAGKMYLMKKDTLNIRGYIGFSLFGKTLTWVRPQQSLEQCRTTN